jgi:hypothetical protein
MSRACLLIGALVLVVAAFAAPTASGARGMQVGIFDDTSVLGNPVRTFPLLRQLRTQVVRVTLSWGGQGGLSVARRRPAEPTDPADPAYRWALYDDIVRRAAANRIRVMFAIVGTPRWANGGKRWNRAPTSGSSLRAFAYAAATRYSGAFTPEGAEDAEEPEPEPLPAVRLWLAWIEPNYPGFLSPQYRKVGRNRYVNASGRAYARICNAVVAGVKATLLRNQRVGCGVTSPRGNDRAGGAHGSVSPLNFMRAMKRGGARGFDAYAHHPYYGKPSESPRTAPSSGITLANLGRLTRELTRLYGRKRIWLTEYGYQTRPPDRAFGVPWIRQARYLSQAFAIARRHPRVDMMIWFLLRDEPRRRGHDGWQSGLMTIGGRKKPSFTTFRRLPH